MIIRQPNSTAEKSTFCSTEIKNKTEFFFWIQRTLWLQAERTKQMEQILRAKVKIFFKSENLKNAFSKK